MRRRAFLAAGGTALATVAGCSSDGGGADTPTDGGTDDAAAITDSPIGRDLADQPRLGPDPTAADSVIVEVTDPSCPTCRSFHDQTFPRIRSDLIEPGHTAFVVRNVDWVYDWAPSAAASLEAVHDRTPETYWELLAFYFDNQGSLGTENVLEQTAAHLEGTDVDSSAVIESVEAGEYDDAVAADVDAARAAGAEGQPYFFLYRDGALVTDFRGAQSYDVFASSLGY